MCLFFNAKIILKVNFKIPFNRFKLTKTTKRCTHLQKIREKICNSASQSDVTMSAALGITGGKQWQLQSLSESQLVTLMAARRSVTLQPKVRFP